jgi:lipopolysaccharide biosynthesis glycosyltransferase
MIVRGTGAIVCGMVWHTRWRRRMYLSTYCLTRQWSFVVRTMIIRERKTNVRQRYIECSKNHGERLERKNKWIKSTLFCKNKVFYGCVFGLIFYTKIIIKKLNFIRGIIPMFKFIFVIWHFGVIVIWSICCKWKFYSQPVKTKHVREAIY